MIYMLRDGDSCCTATYAFHLKYNSLSMIKIVTINVIDLAPSKEIFCLLPCSCVVSKCEHSARRSFIRSWSYDWLFDIYLLSSHGSSCITIKCAANFLFSSLCNINLITPRQNEGYCPLPRGCAALSGSGFKVEIALLKRHARFYMITLL